MVANDCVGIVGWRLHSRATSRGEDQEECDLVGRFDDSSHDVDGPIIVWMAMSMPFADGVWPGAALFSLRYAANSNVRMAFSTSSPSIGGLAKKFRYLSSTGRNGCVVRSTTNHVKCWVIASNRFDESAVATWHPQMVDAMRTAKPVEAYAHPHQLHGICVDSKSIYWSFTTTLVKTDLIGELLKKVPIANHHSDLCFHDGKLFVAVSLGKFNDPNVKADSWVYVYEASTLKELARHEIQEVFHGAGPVSVRRKEKEQRCSSCSTVKVSPLG